MIEVWMAPAASTMRRIFPRILAFVGEGWRAFVKDIVA